MKIRLHFKTPDVLENAMLDGFGENFDDIEDEETALNQQKLMEVAKKYMKYGETITVEFDSETGKATVVEV